MVTDFGFNLCVMPFPNFYIPNFKLERLMLELFGIVQSCSEVDWSGQRGERFRGSDVLDRR